MVPFHPMGEGPRKTATVVFTTTSGRQVWTPEAELTQEVPSPL